MKKKSFVGLCASALLASLLLAGCGSNSADKKTDTGAAEVTVWAWDAKFNIKAFEIAEDIYDEAHPDKVDLNIVENAQDDIVQKLNTALSSGVTKGLPNIVLIEDYRAQSFLQAYPDSFFPLSDFMEEKDFAPYKIEATSYKGDSYAMPFDTGVTGLYVRTDYLEKAGYTTADLQNITWTQLLEIAKVIKEKAGVDIMTQDPNDLGWVRAMINSSGAWYTKEDGKTPAITGNAALKEAFETYKAYKDAGVLTTHSDWAKMLEAFNGGKVASVPQGNWITPSITAEESQSGKWAVVPWPRQSVEGSVNASNLGGSSVYVLNLDGKEAAADFLKETFGSSKDFYQAINKEIGAMGTYLPAAESGIYETEVAYFGGQKIYSDFAKWSAEIPAVNYGENTYAIEDILEKALQEYLGGADLDKVLETAQKEAESQLK